MAKHDAQERINKLLGRLLDTYDPSYGLGSMTCSVYDTAWVACVSKTVSGRPQWLFPSSFSFVLNSQLPDGGWPAHPNEDDTDEVDGIVSTAAALFSLTQHAKDPLQLRHLEDGSLPQRIEKGVERLSEALGGWRVRECNAVGFEILVPSLLDLLQREGIHFAFPGKELLLEIRDQKLAKERPEMLYKNAPLALLHSLEAFHGHKDFLYDRIAHQKIGGSMMASPSATASYLIRCPEWDDEAEAYLRLVVSNGEGRDSGGVPSAYPSTNFELTWAVSTLLEAGLWTQESNLTQKGRVLKVLEESMENGGGLIGFAPGIEPDLDDSAKSSTIFSLLGRSGFTSCIVQHFDSSECLKTYSAERNPSVSANCNALLSIVLDAEGRESNLAAIVKIITFICDSWWRASGSLNDKWNLSPYYPAMYMARSLIELLQTWDAEKLQQLPRVLLQEKVMPTLFRCLVRTLQSQGSDGSWGRKGPREETAYSIITLASLLVLPLAQFFRPEIISAIDRGRTFLKTSKTLRAEYLWIEKVTYSSANLAEAYAIAALHISTVKPSLGRMVRELFGIHYQDLAVFGNRIDRGPLSKDPKWLVLASWIEGRLCVPQLHKGLGKVRSSPEFGGYHEMTAFRWFLANNRTKAALSSQFLCDMIDMSYLNNRLLASVDDALVLGSQSDKELDSIMDAISKVVNHPRTSGYPIREPAINEPATNGVSKEHKGDNLSVKGLLSGGQPIIRNGEAKGSDQVSSFIDALSEFSELVSGHPGVSRASENDRATLHREVKSFLLAQMQRIKEREHQKKSRHHMHSTTGQSVSQLADLCHEDPARDGAASLTGYPHTFAFATCLRMHDRRDSCPALAQRCVAEDVRNCVATVLYLEQTLNRTHCSSPVSAIARSKDRLAELMSYERARLALAMGHLEKLEVDEEYLKTIWTVVDVADLAGKTSELQL